MKTEITRLSLLAGLLLFMSLSSQAQVEEVWLALFDGSRHGNDSANDVTVDSAGNIYITGICNDHTPSKGDYGTVKYSPAGEQIWATEYDGPGHGCDEAVGVAVDRTGNVYITGYSQGDNDDYATIKYNSKGIRQWVARHNGTADRADRVHAMAIDSSGNVYITGSSDNAGTQSDIVTLKYNSDGQVQWLAQYNGSAGGNDAGMSLTLDRQGNVFVAGYSEGQGTKEDCIILKYSNSGQLSWEARYNSPYNLTDHASFICISLDSTIIVTGKSVNSNGDSDCITIRYNPSGMLQWVTRYDGPGHFDDTAFCAVPGSQGCLYILGCVTNAGTAMDYCTLKYNSEGDLQWVAFYDGPGNLNDGPQEMVLDSLENVYVTGTCDGLNPPNADCCTVKYDSSGRQLWVAWHSGSRNAGDSGQALILTSEGRVVVTGVTSETGLGTDFCTIKYEQSTGAAVPVSPDIPPQKIVLSNSYLLQLNPVTIISFQLPHASQLNLSILDVYGRRVKTLVDRLTSAGTHQVTFNASNLASGLYFVRMKAEGFNQTMKVLLVK